MKQQPKASINTAPAGAHCIALAEREGGSAMATFTSYVQINSYLLDLYNNYESATFQNRLSGSFTVDLPGTYYVNVVGSGFKYFMAQNGVYYPYEGTTTSATLYNGASKLGALSGVAITMQQAAQYQGQDPLTVSKAIFAGADTINGSIYKDYLDGFGGADSLYGGKGDDTYIISDVGDKAFEKASEGTHDLVKAAVSYSIGGQYIEDLTLYGTRKINAYGNSLDNVITGNASENVLSGGAGHDTFVFNTALKSTNIDKIADFNVLDDTIQLSKSIFTGITVYASTHEIRSTQLKDITDPATKLDSDDRILYNHDTGALYFDADGSGTTAKVQFATLAADSTGHHPILSYHDILVV